MAEELKDIDYSSIGKIIKDFTRTEASFGVVGRIIDNVLNCDDHDSQIEAMSNLYLCFSTFLRDVLDFKADIATYIDATVPQKSQNGED